MDLNIFIQGFVVIIIIGVTYNLWQTTKAFGGLVGKGLKWIGFGMVFFALEALDRALGNLSFVSSYAGESAALVHHTLLLFGLLLAGIGFSKLKQVAK